LYHRIEKNNTEGYEIGCKDQLVEIDGMKGLLKVAEVVGKWLVLDERHYDDSWRADELQRKDKSINVYAELEKAGDENEFIAAYYRSIVANKWKIFKRKKKRVKYTYQDAKQAIDDKRYRFISEWKANDLSDDEVKQLADGFLSEKGFDNKVKYLRFFKSRKFPYSIEPLLKIANGRIVHKNRAVEWACDSLKFFSDPRIRQLALAKIEATKYPSIYLDLLANNYQTGDEAVLMKLVEKTNDFDSIHRLAYGFIDIYNANPSALCKAPLEAIYNKMNCGIHRKDILQILYQNEVLSEKIFREMQYDSAEEVRALYQKIKKKYHK
jgi:hypothetical protein